MFSNDPATELKRSTDAKSSRYRIGVLLYFRDDTGRVLLIKRSKKPNLGLWCAIGGKLEMPLGESPYECAIRETKEEVGLDLVEADLALRSILSEENYEGTGHWLMFIFEIQRRLVALPNPIDEGVFKFFSHEELEDLAMPPLDKRILIDRLLNNSAASLHVLHAARGVEKEPSLLIEEELIG